MTTKEVNDKVVAILREYYGHKEFGFALGMTSLDNVHSEPELITAMITNLPKDCLYHFLYQAAKQLKKELNKDEV